MSAFNYRCPVCGLAVEGHDATSCFCSRCKSRMVVTVSNYDAAIYKITEVHANDKPSQSMHSVMKDIIFALGYGDYSKAIELIVSHKENEADEALLADMQLCYRIPHGEHPLYTIQTSALPLIMLSVLCFVSGLCVSDLALMATGLFTEVLAFPILIRNICKAQKQHNWDKYCYNQFRELLAVRVYRMNKLYLEKE